MLAFLLEAAPHVSEATRQVAAEIMAGTLKALGKSLSQGPGTPDAIALRTEALADMLCTYLAPLGQDG